MSHTSLNCSEKLEPMSIWLIIQRYR